MPAAPANMSSIQTSLDNQAGIAIVDMWGRKWGGNFPHATTRTSFPAKGWGRGGTKVVEAMYPEHVIQLKTHQEISGIQAAVEFNILPKPLKHKTMHNHSSQVQHARCLETQQQCNLLVTDGQWHGKAQGKVTSTRGFTLDQKFCKHKCTEIAG